MIETCSLCGSDFLTEADPYIVRPTPQGRKLICGCQIKNLHQADSLAIKLSSRDAVIKDLVEVVRFYADPLSYNLASNVLGHERPLNDASRVERTDTDSDIKFSGVVGGKRAREVLAKHKELIEKVRGEG